MKSITLYVLAAFLFFVPTVYSDACLFEWGKEQGYEGPKGKAMKETMLSEMSQQKLKRAEAAADVRNIIPFFEMFLAEPSYSVEDAMQLLGDRQDSMGDRIILKPKSREVVWVQLELLMQPEKPLLAGISVDFARKDALRVSFAELTAKYGEPRMLPLPPPMLEPGRRYKPDFSYQFNAKGKYLEGFLVVTVDGERHSDVNTVIGVIYRRFLH